MMMPLQEVGKVWVWQSVILQFENIGIAEYAEAFSFRGETGWYLGRMGLKRFWMWLGYDAVRQKGIYALMPQGGAVGVFALRNVMVGTEVHSPTMLGRLALWADLQPCGLVVSGDSTCLHDLSDRVHALVFELQGKWGKGGSGWWGVSAVWVYPRTVQRWTDFLVQDVSRPDRYQVRVGRRWGRGDVQPGVEVGGTFWVEKDWNRFHSLADFWVRPMVWIFRSDHRAFVRFSLGAREEYLDTGYSLRQFGQWEFSILGRWKGFHVDVGWTH